MPHPRYVRADRFAGGAAWDESRTATHSPSPGLPIEVDANEVILQPGIMFDVTRKNGLGLSCDSQLPGRAKLDRLEAAASLKDLAALPGNRFEALKGKRKGQYSIRINDQWRVCFEWPDKSPGATHVEIVDYH